MKTGKKNQV